MNEMLGRLARLIVMVPSEMLGVLCDLSEKLASTCGGEWYTELARFLRKEPCWVVVTKVYLRRLYETETIKVGAIDGTETFTSSGLFPGGVFYEEDILPIGKSVSMTPEIEVTVHEQVTEGNFFQVFGETGELEQAQICEFVRGHRSKLRKDGYGTFSRVKGGFVADMGLDRYGRLRVRVHRFSYDHLWYAHCRHRFVIL